MRGHAGDRAWAAWLLSERWVLILVTGIVFRFANALTGVSWDVHASPTLSPSPTATELETLVASPAPPLAGCAREGRVTRGSGVDSGGRRRDDPLLAICATWGARLDFFGVSIGTSVIKDRSSWRWRDNAKHGFFT